MGFLHSTLSFLVLLGILVFVHELGHFLVAKRLGVKVLKFSLGFGPTLFGFRRNETEYVISAIPLGGYVKLFGEDPEEVLPAQERPLSFSARPVSHRLGIVAAGPVMNLVLSWVLFSVIAAAGVPVLALTASMDLHEAVVGDVSPGMPAEAAGIQKGDRIVAVDGRPVRSWEEMAERIYSSGGKELEIAVERGGQTLTLAILPKALTGGSEGPDSQSRYVIGITSGRQIAQEETSPWRAPVDGLWATGRAIYVTVKFLWRIVTGQVEAKNALGGPIAIAQMAGETAQAGVLSFFFLMSFLSVNLGILNFLPIPILDGGHVFFFVLEAVRGRPVSLRNREIAQQVGLLVLLLLMAFVMYNDIMRWRLG